MATSAKPAAKIDPQKPRTRGDKRSGLIDQSIFKPTTAEKSQTARLTVKAARSIVGDATSSRDSAQAYLRGLGMLTPSGNVAKKYSRA